MNNYKNYFTAIVVSIGSIFGATAQTSNSLTKIEKQSGWRLLFDGNTFDGWRRLTDSGWIIKDGQLLAEGFPDRKQKDIITTDQFENFELSVEFKISKLTNSGIK